MMSAVCSTDSLSCGSPFSNVHSSGTPRVHSSGTPRRSCRAARGAKHLLLCAAAIRRRLLFTGSFHSALLSFSSFFLLETRNISTVPARSPASQPMTFEVSPVATAAVPTEVESDVFCFTLRTVSPESFPPASKVTAPASEVIPVTVEAPASL